MSQASRLISAVPGIFLSQKDSVMDHIAEINRRLDNIEQTKNVTILYACESGSRGWGLPSKDSDYDVRFIYVHEPTWYLSINLEQCRDVIECPVDGIWDINGWDLRKALQLLKKSNPVLVEWLYSPIVYRENKTLMDGMRSLLPLYYAPKAAMYHYWHMASKNVREYLRGFTVRRKKYFYVLRPLLACRWIEQDLGFVPMEFEKLMAAAYLDPMVHQAIMDLLELKRSGSEFDKGPRIAPISDYIDSELSRIRQIAPKPGPMTTSVKPLDVFFQSVLNNE
jgi:predicted nucleotidyltransferase